MSKIDKITITALALFIVGLFSYTWYLQGFTTTAVIFAIIAVLVGFNESMKFGIDKFWDFYNRKRDDS